MDTVAEILKLGIVGLIAGLFSSYISTRKHRNEKWWELRVDAYKTVIEALSDLNYYYEKNYKALINNREMNDEYKEKLDKFWDNGYHKVRHLADGGVFLFSDEVNNSLKEFVDLKDENHEDYFMHLDSYFSVTERCLKTVVSLAKKDLKVNEDWL
jgi:hypothetical protein